MLALWRTWWVGHGSKTHGGFKPGGLENVLVLFIRNWEETNRRRYGFGGKKSNSVSVLNWSGVGIPWQCRVDDLWWAIALLVAILGTAPGQAEGVQSLFAWVGCTL